MCTVRLRSKALISNTMAAARCLHVEQFVKECADAWTVPLPCRRGSRPPHRCRTRRGESWRWRLWGETPRGILFEMRFVESQFFFINCRFNWRIRVTIARVINDLIQRKEIEICKFEDFVWCCLLGSWGVISSYEHNRNLHWGGISTLTRNTVIRYKRWGEECAKTKRQCSPIRRNIRNKSMHANCSWIPSHRRKNIWD